MTDDPLIVISGPTASGKSALAIALAERIGAEIVSADSQQVYRGFDIGTAKPSPEELARVPHHLISSVDPHELFSAGRYAQLADEAIAGITARGGRVIVVGGTGLYLRALLRGIVASPPADDTLRAALYAEAREGGAATLHARLLGVDPVSAARIPVTDLVRIVRALELHALTGEPASALRADHGFRTARYPHVFYVLNPAREALHRAIDVRTAAMFQSGLLGEVQQLVARGYRDAAPMRSVGYAQALAHVEGRQTLTWAIEDTATKTRQYAKRQLTWLRSEPAATFVAPPYDAVLESLVAGAPATRPGTGACRS